MTSRNMLDSMLCTLLLCACAERQEPPAVVQQPPTPTCEQPPLIEDTHALFWRDSDETALTVFVHRAADHPRWRCSELVVLSPHDGTIMTRMVTWPTTRELYPEDQGLTFWRVDDAMNLWFNPTVAEVKLLSMKTLKQVGVTLPMPKDGDDRALFLTRQGQPYFRGSDGYNYLVDVFRGSTRAVREDEQFEPMFYREFLPTPCTNSDAFPWSRLPEALKRAHLRPVANSYVSRLTLETAAPSGTEATPAVEKREVVDTFIRPKLLFAEINDFTGDRARCQRETFADGLLLAHWEAVDEEGRVDGRRKVSWISWDGKVQWTYMAEPPLKEPHKAMQVRDLIILQWPSGLVALDTQDGSVRWRLGQ